MGEQWRRFREKLKLCDEAGNLGGSEILPIVVGEATQWIRLDRLVSIARGLSQGGTPTPTPTQAAALPPGTIVAKIGTLPTGWLKCDGAVVSRTQYPRLFAAIGTAYGKGDGTTTFALPAIKARLTIGHDPDPTWMIAV